MTDYEERTKLSWKQYGLGQYGNTLEEILTEFEAIGLTSK